MRAFFLILLILPLFGYSQNDLLSEIDKEETDTFQSAAFKGLKIVNFESTKMVSKKELYFVVSHRFGSIKPGFEDFFGLDQAVTRLNFIYGFSDALNVGVSRSSFLKTYESSIKFRILRQKKQGFPVTIVGFGTLLINGALDKANLPGLEFENRLGYTAQVLVSKKFSKNFSLELIPTFFHDNLVQLDEQENSQYAIGFGGRHKISKRLSLNVDYGWHLNRASNAPFKNPLSIGIDIETGGHVFQLHFTNAQPMNTNGFLGRATGDWSELDVFFGFNLSRVF